MIKRTSQVDVFSTHPIVDVSTILAYPFTFPVHGSFFFFLMLYTLLIMIWALLLCCKRIKSVNKIVKALSKRLFWNSISSLIFESFLNVVVCGLISFKHNFELGLSG